MQRLRWGAAWPELPLLLLVGLLHGLLYWALVPPWQHYDEPTHFEHAQLLALRGYILHRDDFEPAYRDAIASSMDRFRFDPPGVRRNTDGPSPPDIGVTEMDHPRAYYLLAGLPIRLLAHAGVEAQLYGARLVSLLFYLLTITCAYRLACVFAPERAALRLGLPLLMVFSPAFSDIMTAVNNDALANFTAAAFFLGCALLVRDGPRSTGLLLALLGLAAALLSKRSTVTLVPLLPLALYWSLRPLPQRWWAYGAAAGGAALLASLLIFQLNLQPVASAAPRATPSPDAPFGTLSVPEARQPPTLMVRPWIDALAQRTLRIYPNAMLAQALDPESRQRVPYALRLLMNTSSAQFGWSHVNMPWPWKGMVGVGLVVAGAGLVVALGRERPGARPVWLGRVDWLALWSVVTALLVVLAYLYMPRYTPNFYFPTGRYLFVVLLPMLLLVVRGVEGWLPPARRDYGIVALVGFFAVFDAVAWAWTILRFYYL